MSIGNRIALTMVIVLIILFALAAFGYFSGRWDEAEGATPELYQDIPFDAHLLELDKRALDEAYHQQIIKLFGVWLTGHQAGDATHFTNGLRIARRGYTQAAQQIAKREQQLQR